MQVVTTYIKYDKSSDMQIANRLPKFCFRDAPYLSKHDSSSFRRREYQHVGSANSPMI